MQLKNLGSPLHPRDETDEKRQNGRSFVKVPRYLLFDDERYRILRPSSKLVYWACVGRARYAGSRTYKGVVAGRGEFTTTWRTLARDACVALATLGVALTQLGEKKFIKVERHPHCLKITVLDYSQFQGSTRKKTEPGDGWSPRYRRGRVRAGLNM